MTKGHQIRTCRKTLIGIFFGRREYYIIQHNISHHGLKCLVVSDFQWWLCQGKLPNWMTSQEQQPFQLEFFALISWYCPSIVCAISFDCFVCCRNYCNMHTWCSEIAEIHRRAAKRSLLCLQLNCAPCHHPIEYVIKALVLCPKHWLTDALVFLSLKFSKPSSVVFMPPTPF